ncbi:cyclic pyranopterin monophosphate synthase MoaC [Helicobacter winghamensis]|uniref:cyclic pyranopterin monophosphate synthase n=1 Tax=Helicobacter winghamensis TaxID=157268 RepID=A0A2N3PKK1_9HELI|nr:cyclic pyranopterin monophosphate synthase MoaC [Helicobacter winghamensis]EEO26005.1 molybdenum cofactor biosynthesis protein C [Helicobacter winghamensis ATCC BAA-430]PKT77715.1 molybdenum cofactor biosynthesis protein C [Helicobacter winghamensis]PKT81953.1 molybdenum cofactor biosynthesis protein C [Helicobacter winghamensis]PKT82132.1 molybdenum cofactor biosynthesis protein C [Helicobacter winghamensis]
MELTHLDKRQNPKMVDVSLKDSTQREAIASGKITMGKEAFGAIKEQRVKKGAVLQTAIIAAIMGAKRTSELIPMCHPLFLSSVKCNITELESENAFILEVRAKTFGQTGVEMEALMGVNIGLLTIYDMVKAIDKTMVLSEICLLEKSGGKSGHFVR